MKRPPPPPDHDRLNQLLIVQLSPHELEMLTWLAAQAKLDGPAAILAALAADLSASARNGGSDEREFAFTWWKRHFATAHIWASEATGWRQDAT